MPTHTISCAQLVSFSNGRLNRFTVHFLFGLGQYEAGQTTFVETLTLLLFKSPKYPNYFTTITQPSPNYLSLTSRSRPSAKCLRWYWGFLSQWIPTISNNVSFRRYFTIIIKSEYLRTCLIATRKTTFRKALERKFVNSLSIPLQSIVNAVLLWTTSHLQ